MQRSSSEHMFDTMAMEIEQLLSKVLLKCFLKERLENLCTVEMVCEHIKQMSAIINRFLYMDACLYEQLYFDLPVLHCYLPII